MSEEEPVYITTRQLRHRYGRVSHMWVERRMADDPAFPKPVYFGARRFWAVAELEAWERATAAKPSLRSARLKCNGGGAATMKAIPVEYVAASEAARHGRTAAAESDQ